jgi:hypothetical protein
MTSLDEDYEVGIDGRNRLDSAPMDNNLRNRLDSADAAKKRKQIPKSIYKQVNYNDKDELIQLIHNQSNRLGIETWEIEGLILACQSRECLDKGFNVVYEYAGRFDRVSVLLERQHKLLLELTNKIESGMDIRR